MDLELMEKVVDKFMPVAVTTAMVLLISFLARLLYGFFVCDLCSILTGG